jgi:hypothetical protein
VVVTLVLRHVLDTRERAAPPRSSAEGDEVGDLRRFYRMQGMSLSQEELELKAQKLESAVQRAVITIEEAPNGTNAGSAQ